MRGVYKNIERYIKPVFLLFLEVNMAKLTAWLVTLAGIVLLLLPLGVVSLNDLWFQWVLAIIVLAIGIGKLVRNYSGKKRK